MCAGENQMLEQDKRLRENMARIRHSLIVMSGKGGVGKTTVAVNLAYALSLAGKEVGILDVDLHGPNIAKMLGIEGRSILGLGPGIQAVEVSKGLKAVSMGLSGADPDQPVIWRGPMKAMVIKQFLADVNWGSLDYLIIDSPPGTGDEPLSACQLIPNVNGAVIVTSPQDVAIMDARKSVRFVKELKIPVAGIIENMSGMSCPHCGKDIDIFKRGGGRKAAEELGVPFLGEVPFEPELVEYADKGRPFVFFRSKSRSAEAFMGIVDRIREFAGDKR